MSSSTPQESADTAKGSQDAPPAEETAAPADPMPAADENDQGAASADPSVEQTANDAQPSSATGTTTDTTNGAAPGETAPDGFLEVGQEESALNDLIGADELVTRTEQYLLWAKENLLTLDIALQFGLLIAAFVPAAIFGPQLKRLIETQVAPRAPFGVLRRAAQAFSKLATAIALRIILQAYVIGLAAAGRSTAVVEAAASLLTAWIVIRLVTLVIRSNFWSKVAFYIAWPIAALDAFGALDDILRQLDALAIPLGENDIGQPVTFSALDVIRTLVTFIVLFWLAGFANRFVKNRLQSVDELTPSLQALLTKILDILTPIITLLIALQVAGFNLATLTIFGGALGLGIGLGLQRTISNFFAGFTLIADKSIKPGDVIEVGDTFGWVTEMNVRYVSVKTRDGTAHLIPNDKFIEDGVINWSHADRFVRLHAAFGVSYNSRDMRAIKKMAEDTVRPIARVLENPAPVCNLVAFGDSSVDFDLRFWISDPQNGIGNIKSEVFLALWDQLHEMGVEIPFPQQDLHVKSLPEGFGPVTTLESATTLESVTPGEPVTAANPGV